MSREPDSMPDDAALRATLASLRQDQPPARDLFPEIAARLASPDERDRITLPSSLAAELRALRRDIPPPPALWAAIAERLADPEQRDHTMLPPDLRARLAALPREHAPVTDLWPAIAARTVVPPASAAAPRRPRGARLRPFAVAASVLLGVALVIRSERPLGGSATQASPVAARAPLRPSVEAYVATIAAPRNRDPELLRAAYRPISPEARALMQANLQIVDGAEAQIERAMADDPDSAADWQALLDSARQQRAQLRAALDAQP